MPLITIGTTAIPYSIEVRPRRRHPAIQINASRQVTVLVPFGFDSRQVEALLQGKARWLLKHLSEGQAQPTAVTKDFVGGEDFLVQGHPWPLAVTRRDDGEPSVALEDGRLLVTVPSLPAKKESILVREILIQWYVKQAQALFPVRIAHYAPMVGAYPSRIKIAEYKSRWGFCRDDGLVALNWRLIQAPLSVIDYVVVHELTHRLYPHHRRTFWEAVRLVLPAFAESKQWLRTHGAELGW